MSLLNRSTLRLAITAAVLTATSLCVDRVRQLCVGPDTSGPPITLNMSG